MKKYVLMLLVVCCMALSACSAEQGKEQLEIAQFEELQNNKEHAIQLYKEVVSKYPDSPNAKTALERLNALQGSR